MRWPLCMTAVFKHVQKATQKSTEIAHYNFHDISTLIRTGKLQRTPDPKVSGLADEFSANWPDTWPPLRPYSHINIQHGRKHVIAVDVRLLVPLRKNKNQTCTHSWRSFSIACIWLVSLDFCFSAMRQATWNWLYKLNMPVTICMAISSCVVSKSLYKLIMHSKQKVDLLDQHYI